MKFAPATAKTMQIWIGDFFNLCYNQVGEINGI